MARWSRAPGASRTRRCGPSAGASSRAKRRERRTWVGDERIGGRRVPTHASRRRPLAASASGVRGEGLPPSSDLRRRSQAELAGACRGRQPADQPARGVLHDLHRGVHDLAQAADPLGDDPAAGLELRCMPMSSKACEPERSPRCTTRATSGPRRLEPPPATRAGTDRRPHRREQALVERAELEQQLTPRGDAGARDPAGWEPLSYRHGSQRLRMRRGHERARPDRTSADSQLASAGRADIWSDPSPLRQAAGRTARAARRRAARARTASRRRPVRRG